MHGLAIVEADFGNPQHQDAIVHLVDAYARDPMGGGKALPEEVHTALIPGLQRHPTTLVFLAWHGDTPVGIAICFGFMLIFGDIPLWNIYSYCIVLPYVPVDVSHRPCCHEEESTFITTTPDVLDALLPDPALLRLAACRVDTAATQITLSLCSTQARALCPLCTVATRRIHSRYERTLADLPWAAYRVRLRLRVRKWFCRNRACRRRIFTERLPTVAAPWARRTLRLAQRLGALGVALGGTAGVHLSQCWDLMVSRNTLLRLLGRQPAPSFPTPTVLGVDDFALRKRQTYGTILLDLERRQPVALLPDREGDTFAQWLQAHPGVEVITRDRAKAYADGARHGAPQAIQVADRFHLLQNVAETLTQLFNRHSAAFQVVNEATGRTPHRRPDGTVVVPVPPSTPPRHAQLQAAHSRSRRLARHDQIWALRRQGWTGPAIARQLRMGKTTVFRYLRSPTFAERSYKRRGHSILNPYKDLLLQYWNQGYYDARQVFCLLQQQGYRGSY